MRWLWCVALVSACNCDPAAANGTALRVRVNFDEAVDVTQLRFVASHDGGALFAPVVRPEVPAGRLQTGGSLLALLPDALDGQTVECRVSGLRDGGEVASALGVATVKRGLEVPCTVQLSAPRACDAMSCGGCCVADQCLGGGQDSACGSGGTACRACEAGQRCASGACLCDSASCSGCCRDGVTCLSGDGEAACGSGGAACAACALGQHCSNGTCQCDPSSCGGCCAGDSCLDGGMQSACGAGGLTCNSCTAGQACVGGSCTCSPATCGGCCNGNVCVDGGTDLACGMAGASCSRCPPGQTCSDGICGCDGGPCATGCNAPTCPTGCCSGGMCLASMPTHCGTSGVTCFDCVTHATDRCGANDTCVCGAMAGPCPSGLHCVNGSCVCDETVCGGCCQGQQCRAGDSKSQCGRDGGVCRGCSGGSSCVAGSCQ